MKNIWILLLVVVFAVSCKKGENEIINAADDPYKNGVLVFLDSKDFPSILDDDPDAFKDGWTKEEIEKLAKPKKEEIQSFSKKNFDIDLKLDEFNVEVDAWFFAPEITLKHLKIIL